MSVDVELLTICLLQSYDEIRSLDGWLNWNILSVRELHESDIVLFDGFIWTPATQLIFKTKSRYGVFRDVMGSQPSDKTFIRRWRISLFFLEVSICAVAKTLLRQKDRFLVIEGFLQHHVVPRNQIIHSGNKPFDLGLIMATIEFKIRAMLGPEDRL